MGNGALTSALPSSQHRAYSVSEAQSNMPEKNNSNSSYCVIYSKVSPTISKKKSWCHF